MSRAVLDIETDALDATMIHCLGVKEVGSNDKVKFFTTSEGVQEYLDKFDTDRKSTRLNSSHGYISYAVFCLKHTSELQSRLHLVCRLLLEQKK